MSAIKAVAEDLERGLVIYRDTLTDDAYRKGEYAVRALDSMAHKSSQHPTLVKANKEILQAFVDAVHQS